MSEPLTLTRDVAPLRPVRLGPMAVDVTSAADGTLHIRHRTALGAYPGRFTERLEHWARVAGERVFLAQRDASGAWVKLTYGETLKRVTAVAQALIDRGLSAERPVAILSGNDLDHAILGLAALHAGIPYAPISPAYSLVSTDHERLRDIFEALTPGLVFVADADTFRAAIASVVPRGVEVAASDPGESAATPFAALLATPATAAVAAAAATVGPDTIGKFLFTSGSTGRPKGVINTHRMLAANQQMIRQCFAYFEDEPPVILDWSPWNHTAGGNHNFGLVLYNGGSFYLDDGKPTPQGILESVRNLHEVAPTWYFNVPRGYEALLPHLRDDAALRRNFFSRVKMLYVAGAGLSQPVWEELNRLAAETCGERILFGGGLGSTETAPFAIVCTWEQPFATNCGLPAPGIDLKLAPDSGKLEARLKGPNVTPGYWREPALTARAYDAEGYYRMGDALRFAEPDNPAMGLLFDGRIAENFKLATGTWVGVGALRAHFLDHFSPYAADVVLTGLNRDYVGAMIFPNLEACRALATSEPVMKDAAVKARLQALLTSFLAKSTGSSNRVERALVLDEPPSVKDGEITDKGSINQRGVLSHRAAVVEALYQEPPPAGVMVAKGRAA